VRRADRTWGKHSSRNPPPQTTRRHLSVRHCDMAASTATPMVTAGHSIAMNPTSTEHDYRFPRRPVKGAVATGKHARGDAAVPRSAAGFGTTGMRASLPPLNLEHDLAKLSRIQVFDNLRSGAASSTQSVDEMQRQDPLAAQVWRFFSKTKQALPNQQRMENLTWRMMHSSLRSRQTGPSSRCVSLRLWRDAVPVAQFCSDMTSRPARPSVVNTPSGIAQLRKSSEKNVLQPEPMHLDDLIDAKNVATPDHASPAGGLKNEPAESAHAVTSAIPISKSRKDAVAQRFNPHSVPIPPHQREFGYVTRHHRKTSIDDRRVSEALSVTGQQPILPRRECSRGRSMKMLTFRRRPVNGRRISLRRLVL
jgi:GATA-binding protein, other eukaryote